MKKHLQILTVVLFSLLSIAMLGAEDKIYKIGISEYPGYAYKDQHGNYTGIDVEYAYKIAQYANIKVEIVIIPDAETYFNSLEDGHVDMLFDAIKNVDREKKYLFSDYETGNTPLSIYVRNDDDRFEYGNTSQLRNLVFGSETDSEVTTLFIKWSKEHGFVPTVKEYGSNVEINAALDAHEIDAGVYGVEYAEGYRTIMQFMPTPYYIIFRKADVELKNKVDTAMSVLLSEDPLYEQTLKQKYTSINHEIDAFTKVEKDYIKSHPIIKVGVIKNDAPYYSMVDGKREGAIPEYYETISKLTGMNFSFIEFVNQRDALTSVKNNDIDCVAMFSDGQIVAYTSGIRLTRAYTTINAVLVTRSGTNTAEIKKIAVKERSKDLIQSSISADYDAEFVITKNANDGFEKLQRKEVDGMVCGLPSATYLVNQTNSAAYSVITIAAIRFDLFCAVAFDNIVLCSIFNKAIKASQYNFNSILSRNTLQQNNWRTTFARIQPVYIVTFMFTLLLFIILLVSALFVLVRRQKEKAQYEKERREAVKREAEINAQANSTAVRNQFFSNISHDMRTPLNAIIGFSDLAMKTDVPPETRDYLGKIQTSGKLLLALIDDTLTISKMNSGKLRLTALPINSNELYDPLILPVRASAELKHLKFNFENTSRTRIVVADVVNVHRILLNLLSNAVKYTPENGEVTFSVRNEDNKPNSALIFIVSDTGIGISETFLPHIYEPFIQEQRSADVTAGTGLGLSIVKNLVEMMDGKIIVKSIVNKGTTFTVRLPLSETEQHPYTQENEDENALKGKKVLLCEDNYLNAEIAVAILQAKGVTVITAVNGQAGVQCFSESKEFDYSAILMDLRMPIMNGFEAAQEIRNMNRSDAKVIPIIAVTADAFEDDAKKCFESGMNAHITKPIDPDKLFRALSMLIAGK